MPKHTPLALISGVRGVKFKRILSRKAFLRDNIRLCRVMKAVNPLLAGGCGEVKLQPFRIYIQTSSIFTNESAPVLVLWITNISYHEHRRHISTLLLYNAEYENARGKLMQLKIILRTL